MSDNDEKKIAYTLWTVIDGIAKLDKQGRARVMRELQYYFCFECGRALNGKQCHCAREARAETQ